MTWVIDIKINGFWKPKWNWSHVFKCSLSLIAVYWMSNQILTSKCQLLYWNLKFLILFVFCFIYKFFLKLSSFQCDWHLKMPLIQWAEQFKGWAGSDAQFGLTEALQRLFVTSAPAQFAVCASLCSQMPTVLSAVAQSELAAHSINASELTKPMEFAVRQEHEGHREVHLPFHCLASVDQCRETCMWVHCSKIVVFK